MSGEIQRLESGGRVLYVYRTGPTPQCVVVFVHGHVPKGDRQGYRSSADRAWEKYGLKEQFDASGASAAFVVIEAQRDDGDEVRWPDLGALLDVVGGRVPTAAIGHSGAYGTILQWLRCPHLRHVALIDALYGGEDRFRAFALEPGHTLTLIAATTKPMKLSRRFINGIAVAKRAEMVKELPEAPTAFGATELEAKIFFVPSSGFSHSGLVLSKKVIPAVASRAVHACAALRNP